MASTATTAASPVRAETAPHTEAYSDHMLYGVYTAAVESGKHKFRTYLDSLMLSFRSAVTEATVHVTDLENMATYAAVIGEPVGADKATSELRRLETLEAEVKQCCAALRAACEARYANGDAKTAAEQLPAAPGGASAGAPATATAATAAAAATAIAPAAGVPIAAGTGTPIPAAHAKK